MISTSNVPMNKQPGDAGFTVDSYRELLVIAKQKYRFVCYDTIPWGQRFILWRHDCDYSLNRAHALSQIEAEEGVRATYFLNPHCEFYNLFEKKQHRLVQEIIAMGHEIGLHFDAAFHGIPDEDQLRQQIAAETILLENLYSIKVSAFSFHNPAAAHLSYEAETYGKLVNCYSRRFKTEVPYCSDSNGYWRFRCLRNVLTEATDPCLQVLTHPGWWQEGVMPARQRIFRSIYGRAAAVLRTYDAELALYDRQNHAGATEKLCFLKAPDPRLFELCDYLWNTGHLQSLFIELWCLHERQINKLCKAELCQQWGVSEVEVNAFFENALLVIDGWQLFTGVYGKTWQSTVHMEQSDYLAWIDLRKLLIHGLAPAPRQLLEEGCVFLCTVIELLAIWGKGQPIHYDGIGSPRSIDIPLYKTADEIPDSPKKKWEKFKTEMQKAGTDGKVA